MQQKLDTLAVVGEQRDPDARVDVQREGMQHERVVERLLDPRDELACRDVVHVAQQETELVAAESGDRVGAAHAREQALAELVQQRVATLVAEGVVHVLESVEVHQQDGVRACRAP